VDDLDDARGGKTLSPTDTLELSMDGAGQPVRKPGEWLGAAILVAVAVLLIALLAAGVVYVWMLVL